MTCRILSATAWVDHMMQVKLLPAGYWTKDKQCVLRFIISTCCPCTFDCREKTVDETVSLNIVWKQFRNLKALGLKYKWFFPFRLMLPRNVTGSRLDMIFSKSKRTNAKCCSWRCQRYSHLLESNICWIKVMLHHKVVFSTSVTWVSWIEEYIFCPSSVPPQ